VISPQRVVKADVAIRGEKIAAVGKGLTRRSKAAFVVDASGRYVIPGGIDAHVHFELPVAGTVSSDDFDTGTRAAARGGITTVIDFATAAGNESLADAVNRRLAEARGKVCVDFALHVCLTQGKRHIRQMPGMVKRGMPTFKQFMAYASRGLQAGDADIFVALEQCARLGGMLLVHAESGPVLDELIARHHNRAEMARSGVRLHAMTRPHFIETEAVQRAIAWAGATGGPLYIVHMSTGAGADLVRDARKRRVCVHAETCPQYLVLDDSVFDHKDGHLYACSPQVKKKSDQQRLWKGLKGGEVSVVASDTCTFTRKQKGAWKGDWTRLPMGLPGVETMLPIIYTRGVLAGRMRIRDLVATCCTNPARLMGLYPRKGAIARGSDADITIIHPTRKIKVDWRKMETNADWNPYQDWSLAGFAEKTFSRGRLIVDDYSFVGPTGWGQFLPRHRQSVDCRQR